jgi:hypothetical protein
MLGGMPDYVVEQLRVFGDNEDCECAAGVGYFGA